MSSRTSVVAHKFRLLFASASEQSWTAAARRTTLPRTNHVVRRRLSPPACPQRRFLSSSAASSMTVSQNSTEKSGKQQQQQQSTVMMVDRWMDSPVGTWDTATWRQACQMLRLRRGQQQQQVGETQQQQQLSLRSSLELLVRLSQERPLSIESAGLMNAVLSRVVQQAERRTSTRHAHAHDDDDEYEEFLQLVHTCMEECVRIGWRPSMRTYNYLIDLACHHDNPQQAQVWLKFMWEQNAQDPSVQPDRYMYSEIIKAWARYGLQEEDAEEEKSAIQIEALVREMQQLYRASRDKSLKPTESAYVSWIVSIANSARPDAAEAAEKVLDEIWEHAVTDQFWPSRVMYNAVINSWARRGDTERCEKLLYQLCDAYVQGLSEHCMPHNDSFSTVICAYARSGAPHAPEKAEQLLQLMQDLYLRTGLENFRPNVVTVTAVLECWAKCNRRGAPQRAERILRRMQEHYQAGNVSVKPNTVTFNTCMTAWARSSEKQAPERVEALFQDMLQESLRPDPVSFANRINAWQRSGRPEAGVRAQAVLDEMVRYSNDYPSLTPTTLIFNRVLLAWAEQGDTDRAHALFQRMLCNQTTARTAPDLYTYNFLLLAWARSGAPDAADQAERILWEMMQSKRTTPDLVSFNTALSCLARSLSSMDDCCPALERANSLLNGMKKTGKKPNVRTYGSLLQIALAEKIAADQNTTDEAPNNKSRRLQAAVEILQDMKKQRINPNRYIRDLVRRHGIQI